MLSLYRDSGTAAIATLCYYTGCVFNDTGLSEGTHSYQLTSTDASTYAESAKSAATTGTIADSHAPSQPASFAATGGDDDVQLSWSASTDNVGVTGYKVYRGGTLLATVTGLSYDDATARNGTTYSYTVRATDAAANLSTAASAEATPTIPTGCATRPEPYGGSDAVVSELRAARRDAVLQCRQLHEDAIAAHTDAVAVRDGVTGLQGPLEAVASSVQGTTGPQALSTSTLAALHDDSNQLRFALWFAAGFMVVMLVAPVLRRLWLP